MIAEMLCLRYQGLRRIDEIEANCVAFGWKCRRYQNWREVHGEPDDKQILLRTADALINEGRLPVEYFARISVIFLNVQRWRTRKLGLDEEPSPTDGWRNTDTLLRLVRENPALAYQSLDQWYGDTSGIPVELEAQLFYFTALLRLLETLRVPGAEACAVERPVTSPRLREALARLSGLLRSVCGWSRGSEVSAADQPDAMRIFESIGLIVTELGSRPVSASGALVPVGAALVLEYDRMDRRRLLRIEDVGGNLRVTANVSHAFVIEAIATPATKTTFERLISAYAQATREMPTFAEAFETLSEYWGLHLSRST